MSRRSDSSDSFNDTQSTSAGSPGRMPDGEPLTDIYARQYEKAQQFLQDGATGSDAVGELRLILEKSSILCKQEKKVQESLVGSSVLKICAQVTRNQAVALDTNLASFDVQAYTEGIRNFVLDRVNETLNWNLLAKRSRGMFKRSPAVSYMYGSFKATELPRKEPKEKVVRQRANRAAAEKKEPEKVMNVAATDEGNDKAVQHLNRVLKRQFKKNGRQPINFFKCVLDPTSFHLTVENIFHLSFLMKNNLYQIKLDNSELPYIHVVAPEEVNTLQKGKKQQCILSISPEKWTTLVKVFNIKEPMVTPMT